MPTPDITNLTADLRALGGQRVWSLMISLFGDLAQGADDKIDGPVLSAIMSALEVKPEASRVALHRLRNDGWLASVKSGRISRHSLTQKARTESIAASPRIYALPETGPQDWQLVLLKSAEAETLTELANTGYSQLLPRVFIGPSTQHSPAEALVLNGCTAPAWVADQLIPEDMRAEYAKLNQALADLTASLPDPSGLSPLDVAVLRCLIVHNWRRLVLKQPVLPRGLIDKENPVYRCHVAVADLLAQFERPSLASIAQK